MASLTSLNSITRLGTTVSLLNVSIDVMMQNANYLLK